MSQQPKNTTDAKAAGKTLTPEVTWAQRSSTSDAEKNYIYVCINVPDVDPKKIQLDLKSNKIEFAGYSETKKAAYHVLLDLYAEIDPSAKTTKVLHSPRAIELKITKKDLKEEYWPRLLKNASKVHFLKTDFDKWVDEDEQDAIPDDDDYMARMGGMGMGADGGFGGIDFSKLGGAGAGAEDDGEEDDEDEDDDDEEVPGLEDAKAGASGSKKIEEVE